MKVAAWQATLAVREPGEVAARLRRVAERCEAAGVEVLCCPETVLGGLADASPDPGRRALGDEELLALLPATSVAMIVGYTEREGEHLFNTAAVVCDGEIQARYHKVYPGDRSAYEPGAHPPEKYAALKARGNNLLVARAVENRMTVVAADVAGRAEGRVSEGVTAVIDRDGTVLAKAAPYEEDLLIADVPPVRPPPDPRGWDGARNPAVTRAFLRLWSGPRS